MPSLELFSFEACPYAQRTRMTLIEKGVGFELTEIDLFDRPAWFSEISPYGKVPVLRHDGATLYESAIINQYLDEIFPEPPLMPARPVERAQARIWMDYCETRFLPVTHRLMTERDDPGAKPPTRGTRRRSASSSTKVCGSSATAPISSGTADPGRSAVLPVLRTLRRLPAAGGAEWPEDCTRLAAWFAAMQARPR